MHRHNATSAAAVLLAALLLQGCAHEAMEPVDYVDPYIGNISHLLVPTFPTVHLPNSMLRVFPRRGDYTSEHVDGLPVAVTMHRAQSPVSLSVTTGSALSPVVPVTYDNEHISPWGFDVDLQDGAVHASYVLSHQSGMYTIGFPEGEGGTLVLCAEDGGVSLGDGVLTAWQKVGDKTRLFVAMEFQQAPDKAGALWRGQIQEARSDEGRGAAVAMVFKGKEVRLRYGISFISADQARANLHREIKGWDPAPIAKEGRRAWNEVLSRLEVEGGTPSQKRVFYTSYYRTFERPVCMSEDGRYWSPFDNSVHEDDPRPFYNDDWIWDTYRAAHPLRVVTDSRMEEDILASFIRMAQQDGRGWAPTFPEIGGDSRRMNSNHTVASFADAIAKGLDVDARQAFQICRKALLEKTLAPWCGNPAGWVDKFYWTNGYLPALAPGEEETDPNVHPFEKRQPVAVTLGTSYDSWCMGVVADAAEEYAEGAVWREASQFYRNIFNGTTGFFHPRDKQGHFIEPFDYSFSGGMGAREYYDENNGWVYRWDVQHDIPGLIGLMGGAPAFVRKLDETFATPLGRSKFEFYSRLPDHTGNIGQFSMANEPSLHIPYLYNYAGEPWKTQKRIRQVLETWFRDDVMGVPGDEDGGGMTSFVVWSSLGLYPVTPGKAEYTIGSPVFPRASIALSNGKTFEIVARGASRDNKYIRSATLDGKPLDRPFISHERLMAGGRLVLEMDSRPDKAWGK